MRKLAGNIVTSIIADNSAAQWKRCRKD